MRTVPAIMMSAAGVLTLALTAMAQCPEQWISNGWQLGLTGVVNTATVWDPDGPGPQLDLLVLGGDFHLAGETPVSNIAVWDGQSWSGLGAGFDKPVLSLAVLNNQLFAQPQDTYAIHRWDGVSWTEVPGSPGALRGVHNDQLIVSNNSGVFAWTGASWQSLGGCGGSAWLVRWQPGRRRFPPQPCALRRPLGRRHVARN